MPNYELRRIDHKPGTPVIEVSVIGNMVRLDLSSVEDPEHYEWAMFSAEDAQRIGQALLKAATECGS